MWRLGAVAVLAGCSGGSDGGGDPGQVAALAGSWAGTAMTDDGAGRPMTADFAYDEGQPLALTGEVDFGGWLLDVDSVADNAGGVYLNFTHAYDAVDLWLGAVAADPDLHGDFAFEVFTVGGEPRTEGTFSLERQ